jgi:hypothetical protein
LQKRVEEISSKLNSLTSKYTSLPSVPRNIEPLREQLLVVEVSMCEVSFNSYRTIVGRREIRVELKMCVNSCHGPHGLY